ncbi:metallophosphatase [Chloropicon primus]|nr:metallophosphatase [Chloropicon primus]
MSLGIEHRSPGSDLELNALEDVDDLLIRRTRKQPRSKARKVCGWCCSKEVLRVVAFSLVFLILGAIIGHVSVRITTTDSGLYTSAVAESQYTTKFMVVGDFGREGKDHQSDVALQMALVGEIFKPHFIVSTGDNFYPSGLKVENDPQVMRTFSSVYAYPSLKVPWYAVLGNHDYGDGSDKHDMRTSPSLQSSEFMQVLDERWICCGGRDFVSERVNFTDDGLLELFFVDTSPYVHEYYKEPWASVSGGILDEKEKVEAKRGELDLAIEMSIAPWKIVVGHHPVRSNGMHGDTPELLSVFPDLLNKYKVDFYLNGHEHDLQDISEPGNPSLRYITSGAGSRTRIESGYGHNEKNYFSFKSGFVTIALSKKRARVQFWHYDSTMAYEYYVDKA